MGQLAERTIRDDEGYLNLFAVLVPVTPYRRRDLEAFEESLARSGQGPRRRNDALAKVRRFQTWLETNDEYEALHPFLPSFRGGLMPEYKPPRPDVLSEEHQELTLADARRTNPQHFAIITFIQQTGVRPWSLCELRWEEIDREKGAGFWTNEKPNKPSYFIPLSPHLLTMFEEVSVNAARRKGHVFPAFFNRNEIMREDNLNQLITRHMNRVGIPQTQQRGPYIWRHTFIERIKREKGNDVAALLAGHTTTNMVTRVYGKHSTDTVVEIHREATAGLWNGYQAAAE